MVNLTPYVTDEEIKAVAALSDDARAVLKAQINSTNPFTIFDSVEDKADQIICPFCGSGSHGNHNTGITPDGETGVWLYHCFAGNDCEGDLINIIAYANNITNEGYEHFKVVAIAAKVAGINIYSPADETQFRKPARKPSTTKKEKTAKELAQERAAAEYIELSRPNLKDFLARCKNGKWRGLGYDVLNFLRWGFCAKYKHTKNNFVFPAVIIPNDKGGILARHVDGDGKSNLSPTGTTTIYLPEADSLDVVIPESAINGASILQAVPAPPFGIIASGGTSGKKNVVAKVQELIQQGKKIRAILAFDNDSNNAGQNAAVKLRDELLKISIPAVIVDITKQADVDLNDVLQQENGEIKLAQMVTDAVSLAQVELDKVAAEMEKESAVTIDTADTSTFEDFEDAPIKCKLPSNFTIKNGELYHNGKSLSYTPAVVTKKFLQGDKVLYEVAILIESKWKSITVPASSLLDRSKLLTLADFGLNVTSNSAKTMCQYFGNFIGINSKIIPAENLYTQGGWIDESCTEFIYPADKKVLGNNFDYDAAFKICGDKDKFTSLLTEALKSSYVACLVAGVALAAPLVKVVGVSNKQLHLGCRSGNGKTALVKLVLAIYGNPKYLMAKFNGTANALESFSVALNDFPSAIDELQSINKIQRDCIDEIIYNFENGSIRRRLKKDGTLQPFKYFSGCRITTGEQPLTTEFSNEGAKKRCVEINESNILREDLAIEIHRFTSKNFGFYGRDWIEYIKNHDQEIIKVYDETYNNLYAKNNRAFPEHISLIALAQVALKHFCRNFLKAAADEILSTFNVAKVFEQLPIRQDMQNGKRAILRVAEFYTSHAVFFHNVTGEDTPPTTADHAPFECYGYKLKNGDVLIFSQKLKDCLKEFPNFQAILRDFADLGYLDVGKDKTHPYQKAIKIGANSKDKKTIWGHNFKKSALFPEDMATTENNYNQIPEEPEEPNIDQFFD